MSAFIVSQKHINALLNYAGHPRRAVTVALGEWPNQTVLDLSNGNDAQRVGEILLAQNYRSVYARYEGRHGETEKPVETFIYWHRYDSLPAVSIIKACQCYAYQSCETEDWQSTDAYRIIERIKSQAISGLDGYDKADWEIR